MLVCCTCYISFFVSTILSLNIASIPGLSSTVYFPGLPELTQDLHASSISVSASTSLFILFQGLFPIIWSSLSDYFHVRKIIYIVSLLIFAFASLGCCFVQNIWVLVALRCMQAAGASATTLGAGTISDLYPVEKRGYALQIQYKPTIVYLFYVYIAHF